MRVDLVFDGAQLCVHLLFLQLVLPFVAVVVVNKNGYHEADKEMEQVGEYSDDPVKQQLIVNHQVPDVLRITVCVEVGLLIFEQEGVGKFRPEHQQDHQNEFSQLPVAQVGKAGQED